MSDSPTSKQLMVRVRRLIGTTPCTCYNPGDSELALECERCELLALTLAADEPKAPTPADEVEMNRIFDAWFDSLREPPQNYLKVFAAGYAAAMLRRYQPPADAQFICPHGKDVRHIECGQCNAPPPKATHEAIQAAMRAGSWFDRKDLTLHEREIQVAQLFIDYARAAQTKDAANPPGCICRYAHKSDPMCTYGAPVETNACTCGALWREHHKTAHLKGCPQSEEASQ